MNGRPQKKTVALVAPGLIHFGGGVSSVVRFLYDLINSTDRYTATVISLATSHRDPNSIRLLMPSTWRHGIQLTGETWQGIPIIHVGTRFPEIEFLRYLPHRQLTDLLNKHDLIQVISGGPAAAYVARDVTKPVCVQAATTLDLERKGAFALPIEATKLSRIVMIPIVSHIEKKALKRADHIFADTAYTRQAFLPYTTDSRVTIDAIGVDAQKFQPIPERQRADDFILSVGRFGDVRKNVAMLFEAYALLRQRLPGAPRLILAGRTAPPPGALRKAGELGIIEDIDIKENVAFQDLVALYQNAAYFILSSDEEGLGIVLLEAMACATPVVSTRCGGPDTVVSEDVGFLTPVGNAEAMAQRMHWMLQNPALRREMGQAARRMVEQRFTYEVVGQKYLKVYDRLLEN